jgi:hypothetical protein
MTQGKAKTLKTDDLSYIFFKIRETRDSKVRRSWQRRARLALAKRTDLTPAEQHEVCAVWSKSDCNRIDSPALSKCLGRKHIKFEGSRPASCVVRKLFDDQGQPLKKSTPSERHYTDDHTNPSLEIAPHRPESCTFGYAAFSPSTILFHGYIYQRSHHDSDGRRFSSDNRANQRRRRGRMTEKRKAPQKTQISELFLKSQRKSFSNHETVKRHEMCSKKSIY